jgi:hypothetical protein
MACFSIIQWFASLTNGLRIVAAVVQRQRGSLQAVRVAVDGKAAMVVLQQLQMGDQPIG